MFDLDGLKAPRPLLIFVHQLQQLKRSFFSFLLCLPTSLLTLLLLILLVYNGVSVFYVNLPFIAKPPPEPANFSGQNLAGEKLLKWPSSSSSSKLSSMYVVREENAPLFLNTQLPVLPRPDFSSLIKPVPNARPNRRTRRFRKLKRKLRTLSSEAQTTPKQFSTRIREFFAAGNCCKPRFFMTWISSLESFGERESFAVESLFKFHPNACLAIISKTMDSPQGMGILKPFLDMGFKVIAVSADYDYVFRNTPAETWFNRLRTGKIDPGEISLGQNLSNLLRLSLLYKYGGVYTDTDTIFVNSFSKLKNVIGAQTVDLETKKWSRLNNAVLVFDKGHPLVLEFIREFALTFDGNKWGHNGPYLVSRVVSRLDSARNPGFNFTVLAPAAFYPVDWSRIRGLFSRPIDEFHSKWLLGKLKHIRSKSYSVHLWNRQSKRLQVEKGSIIHHLQSDSCIFCNSSVSSFLI